MQKYTIVKTEEDFNNLITHINMSPYLGYDTETTGLNVRKDKVIGISVCGNNTMAFYLPYLTWDREKKELYQVNERKNILKILQLLATKELLMWNGSFDVRVTKNSFGIDLKENLLADVMLMKHTIYEEGDFALKKVAIEMQSQLGIDESKEANEEQILLKENVKANGGSTTQGNYEMFKADLEIMGKYAAKDAWLTFMLGNIYRTKLEEEGLEAFFYDDEVMPLYKYVTIPMEERGVHLNIDLMKKVRADLILDMDNLKNSIISKIEANTEVSKWKIEKAKEKYPVRSSGIFAQALAKYFNLPIPKTDSGKYSITKKNLEFLEEGDCKDFLLKGHQGVLADTEIENISVMIAREKGDFTINISSKQQMGDIVFNCLGIKPLTFTDKGSPQFNDDTIEHLYKDHGIDWARDLGNYNKLNKILGTYIDGYLEQAENGIFYPNFFQHRTISGRYGSNIQQLPRPKEEGELDPIVLKYNNIIRAFFISGVGRVFIDSDYESLEPHVFAHVSNDEGLRDIFRNGHDFYSTIAIATEKLEGVSADKKANNYLGKVNKPLRQSAKAYSLGVPYGMTDYALSKTLGIEVEDAAKLIDGYLNGFPKLKEWMEDSKAKAQYFGMVSSEAGRIRHLPKVKELHKVHGEKLLDIKYRKNLEKKLGKDIVLSMYMDYKNGLNNARNFQIQSLSASIVNRAAIAINKRLKELDIDGWVCAQVHDQIIIDVPEDRAEECSKTIQNIMETNYKLSVDLKAPPSKSKNFKDGH